ncbi:hypothetical protein BKM77_15150 [Pseudomonas syringae]|nr:hypothetical protein AL059_13190 [Pseudomonas syringae pv. papulans]RXF63924.1 hypothetical protein BKM77_15150 [Pseudomonas syringae]
MVESEHCATEVASALVGLLNSIPGCLFRTGFAEADVGRIMFELAVETLAVVGEWARCRSLTILITVPC